VVNKPRKMISKKLAVILVVVAVAAYLTSRAFFFWHAAGTFTLADLLVQLISFVLLCGVIVLLYWFARGPAREGK